VAWIRTLDEGEAGPELAALYERIRDPKTGAVDNVLAIHGLNPDGLAAHWSLYRAAMRGTPGLRKLEREMIACVVSARNGCHY